MKSIQKAKNLTYSLLKKSEKYVGTDMIYLAKGGFWLTLEQITGILITLGLAMIWANFAPKEVYGQYNYILSLVSLLAIFSLGGMQTATTQAVARGFTGTIRPIIETKLRWSLLISLAGLVLGTYYWIHGNNILAISFLIAGIFTPLINSFSIYLNYLAGKKNFELQAKYSLLRTILASASISLAILLTKNVIYILLVYFVINSLVHTSLYFRTLKRLPPNTNIDPKAISYGKHLSLISVIGTVSSYIDRIFVFHYLGAVELAIYSFAVLVPEHINGLVKNISALAMPKLATKDEKEIKTNIRKKTIIIALSLGVIIFLYIASADLIFGFFFPSYVDSAFYSKIYALSVLSGGIALIPGAAFTAKAKTKILYKHNIVTSLIRIVVLFVSVYYFGLVGLVWGYVIYKILSALFAFFLFRNL